MLDADLKAQLKEYLTRLEQPIELIASLDEGEKSVELKKLLEDITALSDKITYREQTDLIESKPAFRIQRTDTDIYVDFTGIPLEHEFTYQVLTVLQGGGYEIKVDPMVADQIRNLEGEYLFETYYSLSCQNCPDVVQALNAMSVLNPNIRHISIDGALFQDEVEEREVMSVPAVFLNGASFHYGRTNIEGLLDKMGVEESEDQIQALNDREPFDVLIVGGGPAGAAAAVYAARKGIRTGVVAERFGGQVLDTLAIENFISVKYTEGPQFAAALEEHVRDYEVDIMNVLVAEELIPGKEHQLKLKNGAVLKARTIVLATGARWRELGVPGEAQYRNRGVAYCPHCDGPLYKGKPVAVIGGGNSGVEAAIDLAGIVEHVTLVEFDTELRADEVLQRKLHSLPNVKVITHAQTTEVLGDGSKVTGLRYKDRGDESMHDIELEGVFVQIGLLPNTEWLGDTVERNHFGEIVVDDRGATSVPGVFAAGDATTGPYKQIVIAAGQGATAALSAFDYMIRNSEQS